MSHFQSLHSNEPLNLHQEAVINELRSLEDATTHSYSLDYLILPNLKYAQRPKNSKTINVRFQTKLKTK